MIFLRPVDQMLGVVGWRLIVCPLAETPPEPWTRSQWRIVVKMVWLTAEQVSK
jgi:hypothetical protein